MKKIYLILAAFTLLSMSLNAQLLPKRSIGTPQFATASAANQAGSMVHKGQSRAPLRLNAGEYTVGPFEGDNYSNGIGYLGYYDPQMILATVILNSDEFIGHEGDSIVGFRFALYGDGTQTVRLGDFVSLFLSQNGYFNFDNSWMWTIGRLGSGSGHESETTSTTVTFTAANDHGTTTGNNSPDQVVKDGVTMYGSDAAFNASSGTTYTYRYYANSTTTFSVASGTITKIEFTGVSSYAVSNFTASTGTLTTSGNNGTWEGSASSVSFTAGSQVRCTQVVVTVESQAGGSVTVGDETTTSTYFPVEGYYQDYGYHNQMIYSASQLGIESGAQITSITFYPQRGRGIPFEGSTVTLKLGNTSTNNYGTGTTGTKLSPSDLTAVATITPVEDETATTWTFTFDQPFTYTGENLLVHIDCPGGGDYAYSYFYGADQSSNVSLWSHGSASATSTNGTTSTFLPKATFAYTGSGGGTSGDYVDLATGQWYDYYLDEPVEFVVPGDTINRLCIGYEYLQYPSGTSGQQLYPLAVNGESTTHNHLFYMTAGSSTSDETTYADGTSTSSGYQYMPVEGYNFDHAQTNQMIYTADQLGLQQGDQITSLSFYPRTTSGGIGNINFSGGSITVSLANTTSDRFSSNSPLSATMTQVAQVTSYTVDNGKWTIIFDTPFTYDGTNLLVQVANTAATWGNTYFFGAQQTNMQSYNSYRGSRYYFLPKATFGYTRSNYQTGWYNLNLSQYGDLAVQLIFKPSMEKTDQPTITYTHDAGYYYITATAPASDPDAEVTLILSNGQTATGTGSVTITVGRTDSAYDITATATAQATGKAVSDPTIDTITIDASLLEPTPAPSIDSQVLDLTVLVTGTGEGDVHMYINGQEVTNPTYLERTDEDYYVTVTVTAQITDSQHAMATTTEQVLVPKLEDIDLTGWTKLPGLFENDEVIIWNDNLMFVDRFTASTANNNQAPKYIYKMTENDTKLTGEPRTTNEHIIPVQLTRSKVWGYYTEDDVLADRDRNHIDLNVLNAEVQMNLDQNTLIYYYTLDRSRNSILDENFLELSYLQNDGARYVEMDNFYTLHEPFPFGTVSRFDSINTVLPASAPQGENGKHYGLYNTDYMAYVPIVWTHGNDPANTRLNYENDGLNNSYGSPIWKTGVGQTKINYIQIERQNGKDNSTNWNMDSVRVIESHHYENLDTIIDGQTQHWQDTTVLDTIWRYTPCSLFMVKRIEVDGFLPSSISNIEYEPYMFRVWVASPTNRLRDFTLFPADSTAVLPGQHYGDTLNLHLSGPFCIWEEYFSDDNENINIDTDNPNIYHFFRDKVEHTDSLGNWDVPDEMNMIFAAEDSITSRDVVFYVRFYYRSTGEARHSIRTVTYKLSNRDGNDPNGYYGVEDESNPDQQIPTSIRSVYDMTPGRGEVVSVTYYNLQGVASRTPFDGINIVVTRYSDGTATSSKMVRVR